MIVANVIVQSTQEDIGILQSAIAKMEQASRAEEGCLDYTFSVELNDPSVIRITEKWDTLESLMAHMKMPHMAQFQEAMGAHPPKSMDLKFYEVTEIQPFG